MLINRRSGLMAGKRLPYDAEVEYLESVGDQYIDTGYKFVFGDTIRATFAPTAAVGSSPIYFFGADTAFNIGLNSHYDPTAAVTGVRAVYGGVDTAHTLSPVVAYSPGTIYACEFTPSTRKINNSLNTATIRNPGAANYTVVLFAARRNATIRLVSTGFAVTEKFFNFSVERNGVKILDFIPVRKGTVGYLYDRVSGKLFGNAGTGDFVLGPDVVPVEYIESHGAEWIDTGFYANGGMILETRANQIDGQFNIGSIRGNNGAAADASRNLITFHGRSQHFNVDGYDFEKLAAFGENTNALCYPCEVSDTTPHTMYLNTIGTSLIAKVDGQTIYSGTTGTLGEQTNSVKISRSDYSGSVRKGRFFYMRLWDANSTLVRSFRPVRVGSGSTWEGAMMDVLTRRIYRNAGTGAFAYGNDLKYPIPAE